MRKSIFADGRSKLGSNTTYAFDLYTRTGKAYKHLTPSLSNQIKRMLLEGKLSWFFLSAGYGIVHALEPARSYQATFNQTIAYQNKIPNTTRQWKGLLAKLIDSTINRLNPDGIFFFGSQDYSSFFKESKAWESQNKVWLFESTGSSGPTWLSPLIGKLSKAVLSGQVSEFSNCFKPFTKQGEK